MKAGDRYMTPSGDLLISIKRVAADGGWADVHIQPGGTARGWSKRQYLLDGRFPYPVLFLPDRKVRR